jgi:16S rRNA (uracil1498-N3)-methyltransferase
MERHYFYDPELKEEDQSVILTGREFYHLDRVLRLKESDPIYLLNGKGLIAKGSIEIKKAKSANISIFNISVIKREKNIILLQSLIKKDAMDLVVEKAQELGIKTIFPLISSRTVIKLKGNKKDENRLERWKRIASESMKQSGNPYLTEISEPRDFQEVLNGLKQESPKYILNISGQKIKNATLKSKPNNFILVGPEGDFTEQEYKIAELNGFSSISLGNSRLRSETAAISAISIFRYLLE